jgi:hypothetical protein
VPLVPVFEGDKMKLPIPATSACTSNPEGGGWEVDGCWYDNALDAVQGAFGFCGCGSPDENVLYILAGLKEVRDGVCGYDTPHQLFFRYWLDVQKLTEHGCGIGSGWLTKAGEDLLAFIESHKDDK